MTWFLEQDEYGHVKEVWIDQPEQDQPDPLTECDWCGECVHFDWKRETCESWPTGLYKASDPACPNFKRKEADPEGKEE